MKPGRHLRQPRHARRNLFPERIARPPCKGRLAAEKKKIKAPIEYKSDAGTPAAPSSCSGAAKTTG